MYNGNSNMFLIAKVVDKIKRMAGSRHFVGVRLSKAMLQGKQLPTFRNPTQNSFISHFDHVQHGSLMKKCSSHLLKDPPD